MKRGFLLSIITVLALSLSAAVPQRLAEKLSEASLLGSEQMTVNSEQLPTINYSLFTVHSAPESKAVAPSPRIQPLLPIVRHPSIKEEDQKLADAIFRTMIPVDCIDELQNFYVVYDKPLKSRGYAGKDTVIIQGTLAMNEKIGILIHELTHFRDLSGCSQGTAASGLSDFKDGKDLIYNDDPSVAFYSLSWIKEDIQKKGSKKADFVTGYAAENPFEDLAESVTYYALRKKDFIARAKKNKVLAAKLAWIETNLFPGGVRIAEQVGTYSGKIPWDATKLAFTWKGEEMLAAR